MDQNLQDRQDFEPVEASEPFCFSERSTTGVLEVINGSKNANLLLKF